jgi:hypothetical protein
MGAEWKYGEPMVKVYGAIIVNDQNMKTIIEHTTSIFYKNVAGRKLPVIYIFYRILGVVSD